MVRHYANWCCSVPMACVRIPLREEGKNPLSTKFELNTVGSNVQTLYINILMYKCINGIIVRAIYRRLGESYTIGICCFSAKHATLRNKSKDCLHGNQNIVSVVICLSSNCCYIELAL